MGAMGIVSLLPYAQIALSVALVACILLQQTGASQGGAFGGDNFSATYHTRRGAERLFFYGAIVLGGLLALSSLVAVLLS